MSSSALRRAVKMFGSRERLAAALGVHVNTIAVSLRRGWVTKPLALAIQHVTGGQIRWDELTIRETRPDQNAA